MMLMLITVDDSVGICKQRVYVSVCVDCLYRRKAFTPGGGLC